MLSRRAAVVYYAAITLILAAAVVVYWLRTQVRPRSNRGAERSSASRSGPRKTRDSVESGRIQSGRIQEARRCRFCQPKRIFSPMTSWIMMRPPLAVPHGGFFSRVPAEKRN